MNCRFRDHEFRFVWKTTIAVSLHAAALTMFSTFAFADTDPSSPPADEQQQAVEPPSHMSEALRASVRKVVVLPGSGPAEQSMTGTYKKETAGLYGGAESGSRIGQGVGTEVGPVSMRIPIPVLTLPGALIGGIAGKTKRDIQEFRDALTDDLANASSQPLTNDALASDVWWNLRRLPKLDSKVFAPTTPIPEETDAILYVELTGIAIDVKDDDAIITTSANATLRRHSDGEHLYEGEVSYQDRDSLSNWTRDEKVLWRDYLNFARHYIGREISAEVFDRVTLQHILRPKKSDTIKQVKKNDWQGVTRTVTPTLAWELELPGGDAYVPWADALDEASIDYDVEIYDQHRLVYAATQVPEPRHTVEENLEACRSYRWSVRPSYRVDVERKFGEWMRFSSDDYRGQANVGRKASAAPAYTQDFASLDVRCGSK